MSRATLTRAVTAIGVLDAVALIVWWLARCVAAAFTIHA